MRNLQSTLAVLLSVILVAGEASAATNPGVVAVPNVGGGPPREEPVGLLLTSTGGKVLRANTETPLASRAGDVIFSGDELKAETGASSFLYCPAKQSESVDQGSDLLFDAKQIKVKAGKIAFPKPVNSCFLPQVVRVNAASQQHYGVSMTRGLERPEGDILPLTALAPNVQSDLKPFEDILKGDPANTGALVNEAAIFDNNHLEANALAAYRKIASQWKDAVWVKGRIFDLEESLATQAAIKAAAISPDAKTYALLIGVSKYEKLPQDLWLQYADADAKTFSQHLASPRGGAVPAENMVVLTNEQATTAAVRNAFQTFLKQRAGPKDTIFILVAGHGSVDSRGAYIMTYDSDPEDLSATALPMAELQSLVNDELNKVGRVVFLADVCRAATIGNLKTDAVGAAVEKLGEVPGEMLGLMAARPKEVSYEGPTYGGGHGAFTYSVLKGLEGAADNNDNKAVEAGELIDYVRDNVSKETNNKQHPRDFGNMANETKLSDLSKSGIPLARIRTFYDSKTGDPLLVAQAAGTLTISPQAQADIDAFQAAIGARRILPTDQNSAWNYLPRLRTELSPEREFLQENLLRVALEDQAQQVLLRYLAGGDTPQVKTDFDNGANYMEAAIRLTPESMYLQARDNFFAGRSLVFDKQYTQASNLLEQSVRLDPGEAYGYNALGISYLEQARYAEAIPAFRDASRRAPNWTYPLLGLALSYQEMGDNTNAVRTFQLAMKVGPQYGFLPYDLGMLYQKMNRRSDAEANYRKAMALMPNSAMPLNALGALKAVEGKNSDAEKLYRDALAKEPNRVETKHNLAVLLATMKGRQQEAIDLWRQNLQANPDYLASRISLAELLAQRGDNAGAIEQYRIIVNTKPEFVAARTALAEVYIKANQPEQALEQLQAVTRLDTQNAAVWERVGDIEKSLGHANEARDAYAAALKLDVEKSDQKRVRTKMAF
ncbi:MAG TPA: tetratricopeptide repeat protein [Bryobacteraceae bacterium]|nr:tetratricopeptide repeat protein [Bryobacteraceae bacterium]